MKYQGIYFNPELAKKYTVAKFRERFGHLWPEIKADQRQQRLTEVHGLLKKFGNANRK